MNTWTKIAAIIKAAEAAETSVFPLVFHSAEGQGIAGVIMLTEELAAEAIPAIAAALHPAATPTPAPAPTPISVPTPAAA